MAHDASTDRRLIELGATFDEITAAMERIPDGEAIPEALHEGLARVTDEIEELSATSRETIRVNECVRCYYELIEAEPWRAVSFGICSAEVIGVATPASPRGVPADSG